MKHRSRITNRMWRTVLLGLLSAGLALAQATGSIRGTIVTRGSGGKAVPLAGVSLVLYSDIPANGIAMQTMSDESGSYSFDALPPQTCRITASAKGFRSVSKDIEVKPGHSLVVDIQVELETVIQKVDVQEHVDSLSTQAAPAASSLQSEKLETLPIAEQTFRDALRVVPGVVRTGDEKLNIRGSAETQSRMQVNSIETNDPVTGAFSVRLPMDAIQKLSTDKVPFDARYGGFSGSLIAIETKPPSPSWHWKLSDFLPSLRGRGGHWVGYSQAVPRLTFGGSILPQKLNFLEAFQYEMEKTPVRGLAWPHNEVKKQGFNSYTSLQAPLSSRHIITADMNVFPRRVQFADITALIPQTASADYGQRGMSGSFSDFYQFDSGLLLRSGLRYARFDSRAHGQGPADMLVTPGGWEGNFFNQWARKSNDLSAFFALQLASKAWRGHHDISMGADLDYRSFIGPSASRPVRVLRQDGSLAERIDFQNSAPLSASIIEGAEFFQDHWTINGHLALTLGARLTSQSVGRPESVAPRLAIAYSPSKDSRTILRVGAGLLDGRVSLLDADFAHNPKRVVSLFDETGAIIGTPRAFQNAYVANGPEPILSRIRGRPNSSPRAFEATLEFDHRLSESSALRLAYIFSHTYDQFVVNPLSGDAFSGPLLTLENSGVSRYHEFEATLHLQPIRQSDLNLSYIWSLSRGDLNMSSTVFIPFEQPVIHVNAFGVAPSDVPNRFIAWGTFHLPWEMVLSPALDLHTGLPYSNVDVLQSYVGTPNGLRFPTFFSLDTRIYRDCHLPLPGVGRSSRRKVRLGLYSINLTNHKNYRDVYNNVASPFLGRFAGFDHRINGFVLEIVE